MKKIKLTQGFTAVVDDEDYERVVAAGPWHVEIKQRGAGNERRYGAHGDRREGKVIITLLHRFILGVTKPSVLVDHVDYDGLNCQRYNMRLASNLQNTRHQRKRKDNTSGCKGVHWNKDTQKWMVRIAVNGIRKYLGLFSSLKKAMQVYDDAAIKYHGVFSATNASLQL